MVKEDIVYYDCATYQPSLWRNRLARSAVNRKVGGSSPPRDDFFFAQNCDEYYRAELAPTSGVQGVHLNPNEPATVFKYPMIMK